MIRTILLFITGLVVILIAAFVRWKALAKPDRHESSSQRRHSKKAGAAAPSTKHSSSHLNEDRPHLVKQPPMSLPRATHQVSPPGAYRASPHVHGVELSPPASGAAHGPAERIDAHAPSVPPARDIVPAASRLPRDPLEQALQLPSSVPARLSRLKTYSNLLASLREVGAELASTARAHQDAIREFERERDAILTDATTVDAVLRDFAESPIEDSPEIEHYFRTLTRGLGWELIAPEPGDRVDIDRHAVDRVDGPVRPTATRVHTRVGYGYVDREGNIVRARVVARHAEE